MNNKPEQLITFKSFLMALNESETPRPKGEKRFRHIHTNNIEVKSDPSASISPNEFFDYDNNEIDLNDINFDSELWDTLDHTGGDEEDEKDFFDARNDEANSA
jgi:hypothetical protein